MKSRREAKGKTASQLLFEDKEIITARPEYMSYQEYRVLRNHQRDLIKVLHPRSMKKR